MIYNKTRSGTRISQKQLNSAMNLNIALGTMGTMWVTVCSPQSIFNVFFKNLLGASSGQLGLLVGIIQFSGIFHLISIFIYGYFSHRKPFWMAANILHRLLGLALAVAALVLAKSGNRDTGIKIIFYTTALSWILANSSASGWWSWIADLIPEKNRATFFGRRSAIIYAVNIAWFFGVTTVLDIFSDQNIFYIYALVFAISGVAGLLDIVLHAFIPEPPHVGTGEMISLKAFIAPLKNKNFLFFSIAVGLCIFAINVITPFVPPYITAKEAIGAPNAWLAIMFVITQLTWIGVVGPWGVVMDRFGRKPVVVLGSFFSFSWIGYFFLTSKNYTYILPVGFVVGQIARPGIFRTFINISVLGGATSSSRVAQVLRTIENSSSNIVVEDVLSRLDDPDIEVREEAARALGRIRSPEAVEALIEKLKDPASTIRAPAARALGRIGDKRALPYLMEGLASKSEELQESCAEALGKIGGDESVKQLLKLFSEVKSERVIASGAIAASKLGALEAAWEILPRMQKTLNPVLQRQLAIAMGNLLGRPGEFYPYVTGDPAKRESQLQRLFSEVQMNLNVILKNSRHLKPESKKYIQNSFKRIQELFEEKSYKDALHILVEIALDLITIILGKKYKEDGILKAAFKFDPRLGLWWWFLEEISKQEAKPSNTEAPQIDILLGVYFLSSFPFKK
ncbi:MAG: MFS transporter [Spirochaetota bacterium]